MKIYNIILLIVIIFLINSCSGKDEKVAIKEIDIDLQMIDSYKEGMKFLKEGDAISAAKKFNEAELLFPQSKWAPRAVMMAGYSYYTKNLYGDAIFEIERLIKTYPNYDRIDYAHFLLAICHYESVIDETKDMKPLLNAKEEFEYIIKNYPNTDFSQDSKYKLELILDILAAKEMYVAKYYFDKEKWIPAINRYKTIVKDSSSSIYIEEALHRLVEIHYRVGLEKEAKKYAKILGYNYPSSIWYQESYKIFNKNDKGKIKLKDKRKNRREIIKRFKKLFE